MNKDHRFFSVKKFFENQNVATAQWRRFGTDWAELLTNLGGSTTFSNP
jgi:hypothetical protein